MANKLIDFLSKVNTEDLNQFRGTLYSMQDWVISERDNAVTQEVYNDLQLDLESLTGAINFLLELEELLDER